MDADAAAVVTVVSGEPEAEIACGLLRSGGFECGYRLTQAVDSPLEEFTGSGPREVIVHEADLAAARAYLDAARGS